jgi:hypothetical protein
MEFKDLIEVTTFIVKGKELLDDLAMAGYLHKKVSPHEDYEGREEFLDSFNEFAVALYRLQSAMETIWDKGRTK